VSLFSGGHDSASASAIAKIAGADFALHVNTGIGIEQTREYVYATSDQHGWKLREYKATENTKADGTPDPQIYEELVREAGFPGPFMHRRMYSSLKQRQLERFEREIAATPARPVIYLTGSRTEESTRRMGTVSTEPEADGRKVWLNHIHDFTKSDCANCMAYCGIKRNEVVDLIHKSGECLCGAFAQPGEFSELKLWFPDVAKRIETLEKEVESIWPWKWEDPGPPKWFQEKQQGQEFMFDYDKLVQEQPLCRKCNLGAKWAHQAENV
jgi:3'-phosphoadenosine 5'-phosphosulfate sulfotransferase (PAPS reductase)/FAD synthetase